MLKLLGLCAVVGMSTALGYSLGNDLKKRVEQLIECKRMFVMLQGEIKYAKTPLSEGFAKVANRVTKPFSGFLSYVSEELEERSGKSLIEIFTVGVDLHLKGSAFSKDDLDRLKDVGSHLGYLDMEMQIRTIDLYLEQLNDSINQAKEEYQNKSRVYRCLGLMGGLFLAIIFI